MERGAFHLMRIGNAIRRGSEDRFIGQVLANILATCIIARVLAHKLDVGYYSSRRRNLERGSFHLMRIGNAMGCCVEDRFICQGLANILATCVIARVSAHKMELPDVCLPFLIHQNSTGIFTVGWSSFIVLPDPAFAWSFIFMV